MILDLPTIRPHKLSVATMDGQVLMLVRVHCSDGIVGLGEGTTIGGLAYGGESPESMKTNIDTWFAPPAPPASSPERTDTGQAASSGLSGSSPWDAR